MPTDDLWQDADMISVYNRAQAIADGELIDLSDSETGEVCRTYYKYPIACTAIVWCLIQQAIDNNKDNSLVGILHDILWMSKASPTALSNDESTWLFEVFISGTNSDVTHKLKIVCGAGDNLEPVLTLMLQGED
jgi:hypothetical protein